MDHTEIKAAMEAVLFAAGAPVPADRLAGALETELKNIEAAAEELMSDYNASGRGLTIIKLEDSYQMCNKKEYGEHIRRAMDLRRNTPLSQAALEVLAVVAYNQPVTKAFVEQVRGVDCSGVIGSLTTKGLVEEKGRLELPGRPLLYGTTENFLRSFQLSSIDDLPPLPEKEGNQPEEDGAEQDEDSKEGPAQAT